MATRPPEEVEHFREQLAALGFVEPKRFFGGWALRCEGHQFAVLLLGAWYLVADEALREDLKAEGSRPFRYEKKGKWVTVERFYELPDSALDDPETLLEWARRALAVAMRGKA